MKNAVLFLLFFVSQAVFGSVTVTVNGTNHTIPQTNERGWGNAVTAWIQAISTFTLQPTGGNFTLSADVNFGASYGLKSAYFSSRTSNASTSGLFRLAVTDTIGWRNNANGGNLLLSINGSDQLLFNGNPVTTNGVTGTAASISGEIVTYSGATGSSIGRSTLSGIARLNSGLLTTSSGISLASEVSGILPLANGGTSNAVVASQGGVAFGTATGISLSTAGTSGQFLKSAGTAAPNFAAITLSGDVTGILPLANGGTNANITASNGGFAMSTASAISIGPTTATSGQIPRSGGAGMYTWSTATYPATAGTSGNVLTSDGTNWVSSAAGGTSPITSKSGAYTATTSDVTIVFTSSATLSLPAAASNTGRIYQIISTGTAIATIDPNGSETVCGQLTIKTVGGNDGVVIQSDGSNWIGLNGSCEFTGRAVVNNTSGSQAVNSQQGAWLSTSSCGGTGVCTYTMTGFSGTPACNCSAINSGSAICQISGGASASSVTIRTVNGSFVAANENNVPLICRGPR